MRIRCSVSTLIQSRSRRLFQAFAIRKLYKKACEANKNSGKRVLLNVKCRGATCVATKGTFGFEYDKRNNAWAGELLGRAIPQSGHAQSDLPTNVRVHIFRKEERLKVEHTAL